MIAKQNVKREKTGMASHIPNTTKGSCVLDLNGKIGFYGHMIDSFS